ncbi:MAG: T9SS type A sorting domain-containing protein [Cyclobacteriaceae bacterium]
MYITILTMAALLAFNITTLAADDETLISVRSVNAQEKQAFIRVTQLSENAPAILKIKDMQGRTLHREVITDQTYMKRYNFSSLPSGEYVVEVKTKNGVSTEAFQISAGQKESVYFKPAIQLEEDVVKVAFMNRIASPVTLKLFAENGRLMYEETVASQAEYAKGLNVSKLQPGQYSLSLMGDNYVYSRSIEVK